jgi:hypothetical protein
MQSEPAAKRPRTQESGLDFDPEQLRSYIKKRVLKKHEFLVGSGIVVDGKEHVLPSRCHFNLNNEYLDAQSSYLSFNFKASLNLSVSTKLRSDFSLYIDHHPISLIRSVRFMDKNNKEVYKVDRLNKIAVHEMTMKKECEYLQSTLGFGAGWKLPWEGVEGSTVSVPCVIPLAMLSGIFGVSNLLTPHLLNDGILEIEWEQPDLALVLVPNDPSTRVQSDRWQSTLFDEANQTSLTKYTIDKLQLNADCYELKREMNQHVTSMYEQGAGIPLQFTCYTSQYTQEFNENNVTGDLDAGNWDPENQVVIKKEIPITQSYSNAHTVSLHTWPEFVFTGQGGDYFDDTELELAWHNAPLAQLCTSYHQNFGNFIRKLITRVHNYHLPQQPIEYNVLPYYDGPDLPFPETQALSNRWREAVTYDINKVDRNTCVKNPFIRGQVWHKPKSIRLHNSYYPVTQSSYPQDHTADDGIKIDFNYPVALQVEFSPPHVERNAVYGGWMEWKPVESDFIDSLDHEEAPYYNYWTAIFQTTVKAMITVEHLVKLVCKKDETLVMK